MRQKPDFEKALRALGEALDALPLHGAEGVEAGLRREYIALMLHVLQTSERLNLLHGMWSAQGLPQAPAAPPPLSRGRQKPRRSGTA